jgi:preprotein translocase subunit SecE
MIVLDMNSLLTYIRESFQEVIHNVTWPEYKQLQKDTVTVIIASVVFAVIIALVDYGFKEVLEFVYSL